MIYCFCRILLEYFARFLRIFADVGVPEEILIGEDSHRGRPVKEWLPLAMGGIRKRDTGGEVKLPA
jgi:hypothetical protein